MWNGEDFINSNPKIIQDALDNYCAKLEHLKKENPSNTEFMPKILVSGVNGFIQIVKKMQETIKSGDPNDIQRLEDKTDLIRSALKKYKVDIKKSLEKILPEFGDDIPTNNDFTRLMSDIDEAIRRMNKL